MKIKYVKKFVSLVLATLIIFSVFGTTALAQSELPVLDGTTKEAVGERQIDERSITDTENKEITETDEDKQPLNPVSITEEAQNNEGANNVALQGNFSGHILSESATPVQGATVKLTQKGTNGEVIAQTTSAANGVYAFNITDENVYGILNIVVEHNGKKATQSIIAQKNTPIITDVIFPDGNRNSTITLPGIINAGALNLEGMYTAEDKEKAKQQGVTMALDFSAKETEVPKETQDSINALLIRNQEVGMYTEVKLTKTTQEEMGLSMHPPANTKLSLAINIPSGMLNKDKYFIIRFADNQAEIIDSTYDEEIRSLVFETDKTGIFALCYESTVMWGKFKWPAAEKDAEETFCYTDEFFAKPSTNYNPSLSTTSLSFAMASFGAQDIFENGKKNYAKQSQNAQAFLTDIGFRDVAINKDFETKPSTDTIGVVVARKDIKQGDDSITPVLAVGLRGANYEREWAGNVTMGTTGNHKGFDTASNKVVEFLQSYVASHPDLQGKEVKLWIVGYSRAAATACLTAAKLDDNPQITGTTINRDNIYAYTFETPRGGENAKNGPLYDNIFNIVNPNDYVTKVAPGLLGFGYYGKTVFLPAKETTENYETYKTKMLERYRITEGMGNYEVDSFVPYYWKWWGLYFAEYKEETHQMSIYFNTFVDDFSKNFAKDRTTYVADYEEPLRNVMVLVHGLSDYNIGFWEFVFGLGGSVFNNFFKYFGHIFSKGIPYTVSEVIADTLTKLNIKLSPKEIEDLGINISYLVAKMAIGKTGKVNEIASMYKNQNGLLQVHMPNLAKAWLESMDVNYLYQNADATSLADIALREGDLNVLNSGEYRTVRIAGLDNLNVDIDGTKHNLFANKAEVDQNIIETHTSPSGEMVIYVPADCSLRINGDADKEGSFMYSVEEYSNALGYAKRINYYVGTTTKDGEFSAQIPEFSMQEHKDGIINGSSYEYSITDANNIDITYSENESYTGEQLISALREIEINADNTMGAVTGFGGYSEGRYAYLTANALEGFEFEGWFDEGGNLLSKETDYSLLIQESTPSKVVLNAKFKAKTAIGGGGGGGATQTTVGAPKTADSQDIYMWIVIALIAGCAVFFALNYRRFKK